MKQRGPSTVGVDGLGWLAPRRKEPVQGYDQKSMIAPPFLMSTLKY